jgi:probable F420-dependent oxidoreductase
MDIGVFQFSTDYAMHPADLGRAAEERGFESIFFPEHTHIPASRKSPWAGGPKLPQEYWHTNDLFVALAMAAATTKKIKIGTGVCLVIERDPIVTAKEVATLDSLSGGRLLFGIGAGWNAEEMAHHGTDFQGRFKVMRERIEAMKALWTEDEAEYHGETVNFDKSWAWPKPAQKPHPPILLGGRSAGARARVIRYGDGWLPIAIQPAAVAEGMQDLAERAAKAGRDPKSIKTTVFGPPIEHLEELAKIGVERVLLGLPPAKDAEVLPVLDKHAKLVGKF